MADEKDEKITDEEKEDSILAINDILQNAADSTRKSLDVPAPDFEAEAEAEIAADRQPAEEEAENPEPVSEPEPITEEQEVINEYSGKSKTDPNASTKRLKALLEAHAADDTALLSYFSDERPRTGQHVDDIYAILDGDVPPEPEVSVNLEDGGRLSDEVPEKKHFVQEEIFSMDDAVQHEELPLDSGGKATFDEDFAALSEKINSGEIHIEPDEEENENQLTLGIDEETENSSEPDGESEKDKKLRMIFDMMEGEDSGPEEDTKQKDEKMFRQTATAKKAKKQRRKAQKEEEQAFEYTSPSQNEEILSMLSRAVRISRLKFIGVLIITAVILFLETATYNSGRPPFLRQGRYGIIYILIDLQLLFFIVMIMSQSFIKGLRAFAKFKLTADSVMSASIIACTLLCLVSVFTDPTRLDLRLYNLTAACSASALALVRYLQCKKDLYCFKVVSSAKPKFTASALSGNTSEAGEFYKYLLESSELFTVKKASFVSGFFARTNRRPESEDVINFLLPVNFVLSVALFLASYIKDGQPYYAFSAAVLLFCAALPLTSYFMISLPVIAANIAAKRQGAAFIGNAVAEEYADAAVLSFADTEAFLPHLVSITSIKTYGSYPIDKLVTRLGMLFDYIEGPLKSVTAKMLDEIPKPDSIRLIDSAADGLYIAMDGCDYYLGKLSYMRHCRLEAPVDETDEIYSKNVGSVMYMAINDAVVAKIYVKYGISSEFDELLRSMHKAGVCVGIKTLDPNINNELLQRKIKYKQCPVAILKGGRPEDMNSVEEKVDSGIVSVSSLHAFLKMFILCDRARHATKSNCIINIAAMAVAVFAVFFLALTGAVQSYSSISVVLFQLLGLLPSLVMSFLL